MNRRRAAVACMATGAASCVAAMQLAFGLAAALGLTGTLLVGLSLLLGWDR